MISQFKSDFLQYLESRTHNRAPQELYDPVNYILRIGGKRLRPVGVLLGHYLYHDDYQRVMPAALAIENFHNFTLLHDDIMDAAPLRRGQATVHEKWNTNTAILSGDVMLIYTYQYLLELEDVPQLSTVLKIFNQTAIEVCEGQQMDMSFETRDDVTQSEYLKMIELKTSVLFAAALQIGALLGGATSDEARGLYNFGRNVGIAFQLQDDLLDTYGDPVKFGKKVGGDIANNKKTYLLLRALELCDPKLRKELEMWITHNHGSETEKIVAVTNIFNSLGIREATFQLIQQYRQAGLDNLADLSVDRQKLALLEGLAEQLIVREV